MPLWLIKTKKFTRGTLLHWPDTASGNPHWKISSLTFEMINFVKTFLWGQYFLRINRYSGLWFLKWVQFEIFVSINFNIQYDWQGQELIADERGENTYQNTSWCDIWTFQKNVVTPYANCHNNIFSWKFNWQLFW